MSFAIYNQNTPLQFLDRQHLDAERTIIDNQVHDIVKNYGMDVLYVSQKKNFPIVPHIDKPSEQNILFHAYGDYIKPDYNEPVITRAYVKFDNDLFAIDKFGLSNDMSMTIFFNKIDFAFDSAMALADNETITKTFKFRSTISLTDPICAVSYADKKVNFKLEFPFAESESLTKVDGTLINFELSPDTIGNKYLYASFNRRYSAKYYVKQYKLKVEYSTELRDDALQTIDIVGKIKCTFTIKNPFKSYIEHERKLTPAVGDLVFIQTVDDKFEKVEITEVLSENKTVSGINPLLATYAYQCACKPYIADNATQIGDIDAATALNIDKLEVIDNLNNNASVTGDEISNYDQLYVDQDIGPVHQDDVYGGYDLATPMSINMALVPLKVEGGQTLKHYYKWNTYNANDIALDVSQHKYTFSADELYNKLRNLFDEEYMARVITENNLPAVDYSIFGLSDITSVVSALNCRFYVDDIDGYGYLAPEAMLNMVAGDTVVSTSTTSAATMLDAFCESNPELVEFVNASYIKGFKSPTGLPYLNTTIVSSYVELIADKQYSNLVKVSGFKYIRVEDAAAAIQPAYKYVKDLPTQIIVDLRDIERNNIDTATFNATLLANAAYMSTTPTPLPQINCNFTVGGLITVYDFGDDQSTRLATNGIDLFVETHDEFNTLYRKKLVTIADTTEQFIESLPYNDKTVNLRSDLSWLTADNLGIYFNPITGNKHVLAGTSAQFNIVKPTELSYKYDITSEPNSDIITFNASQYNIQLTNNIDDITNDTSIFNQYVYIPLILE